MSEISAATLANQAREMALRVVWTQWGALNPRLLPQSDTRLPASVIDPEALVLASLALREEERRLVDVLAWWAEKGASLLSVRRLETLRRTFPGDAGGGVAAFAAWARDAGDTRWKPAPQDGKMEPTPRSGKGPAKLELAGPETLLLRLRAGFGVSAKPDVFCYLLALDGVGASSKETARAVVYADKNVRLAARELVLGGFIEEREDYPTTYATRPGFALSFLRLLSRPASNLEPVPQWIHWWAVFSFLLHVARWAEEPALGTPYLLSSRARALFNEYRWALARAMLPLPDPNHYPGERYLGAFGESMDRIAGWLARSA